MKKVRDWHTEREKAYEWAEAHGHHHEPLRAGRMHVLEEQEHAKSQGGSASEIRRPKSTARTSAADRGAREGMGQLSSTAGLKSAGEHTRQHATISYRSEISDPNFVNLIARKDGARAPCDHRDPDCGQRLSKQFEGLELRTAVLRNRIAALDRLNADLLKQGTKAWRVSQQSGRASPEKRTVHLPPLDRSPSPANSLSATERAKTDIEEERRRKELLYADPNTIRAVIQIQRRFRGVLQRKRYREMAIHSNTAVRLLRAYRKLKISEINVMLRNVDVGDYVSKALALESSKTQTILSLRSALEAQQAAILQKESQEELVRLKEAEHSAKHELFEAEYARKLMEKEKGEMSLWQQRAARGLESFKELKHEYNIIDGSEEDQEAHFKEYPELYKAFRQYKLSQSRFEKERDEYEQALKDLEYEMTQADAAINYSNQEQLLWQTANKKARENQALLVAQEMARKFTDPQVSIRERFRALGKSNDEATRYVVQSPKGKPNRSVPCLLGVIDGPEDEVSHSFSHSFYAGEFCIVEDVPKEKLLQGFSDAIFRGTKDGLGRHGLTAATLTLAMSNVGRRLNRTEAERLVRSFDDDGNKLVDFVEFAQVCVQNHSLTSLATEKLTYT